jgi:hypothetical protein
MQRAFIHLAPVAVEQINTLFTDYPLKPNANSNDFFILMAHNTALE